MPFFFLFRSFKVCLGVEERVGCGKQREATALIQSLVKLQPWFLRLRWKTCLRQNCSLDSCAGSEGPALGQNTHDDDDDDDDLRCCSIGLCLYGIGAYNFKSSVLDVSGLHKSYRDRQLSENVFFCSGDPEITGF